MRPKRRLILERVTLSAIAALCTLGMAGLFRGKAMDTIIVEYPDGTIVRMIEVSRHYDEMQAEYAMLHVQFGLCIPAFYRHVGTFYLVYAPEGELRWTQS